MVLSNYTESLRDGQYLSIGKKMSTLPPFFWESFSVFHVWKSLHLKHGPVPEKVRTIRRKHHSIKISLFRWNSFESELLFKKNIVSGLYPKSLGIFASVLGIGGVFRNLLFMPFCRGWCDPPGSNKNPPFHSILFWLEHNLKDFSPLSKPFKEMGSLRKFLKTWLFRGV
jgi:hypothetical protein